jgi:hypothetical protein
MNSLVSIYQVMNSNKCHPILIIIMLLLSTTGMVYGQKVEKDTSLTRGIHAVFSQIGRDQQNGLISKDQAILNKFYYIFDRQKLNTRYQRMESNKKVVYKCLTPLIVDYNSVKGQLSKTAQDAVHGYIYPKIAGVINHDTSASGRFVIMYTTSGRDSVSVIDGNNNGVPDYVDWAASYADSSWNDEVKDIGFTNPVVNGRPYVIQVQNLTDSFGGEIYGYTTTDTLGNTKMYINNDFGSSGFPNNWDPDGKLKGAMKVTIAHELKHAIQYRVDGWTDKAETSQWLEMDATMMEDVVFDPVDDYINYLGNSNSIFSNPQYTMYPGSYYQVTWALYFVRNYGITFWKRVWDDIKANNYITMKSAVTDVLKRYYNKTFNKEFTRDYLWHYATGTRSDSLYGFKDKKKYPTARLATDENGVPQSFFPRYFQTRFSGIFQKITTDAQSQGDVYISFFDSDPYAGVGLLATKNDGTSDEIVLDSTNSSGMINIKTPWRWENIKSLGLVSVNYDLSTSVNTRLLVGANKILYGDVNDDGVLNDNDAYDVLNFILGIKKEFSDTRFFGDVSDNKKLTPYDASLIMRHLNGSLAYFNEDANKDGRGPDVSVFQSPQQLKSPVVSYTPGKMEQPFPIVQNGLTIKLDSIAVPDNSEDARLALILQNPDSTYFSSLYIKITFPYNIIQNVQVDTSHSIWNKSINQWVYNAGTFQLAIAEPDSFRNGVLAYLNLTVSQEADANMVINNAELNEDQSNVSYGNLTMHVKPRTPVGLQKKPQQPQKITLGQNYPNPFNPTTVIRFTLPSSDKIVLDVFNITGRKVATLANGVYSTGVHSIQFNGQHLASGIYFYQLRVSTPTGEVVKRHKMVLIK